MAFRQPFFVCLVLFYAKQMQFEPYGAKTGLPRQTFSNTRGQNHLTSSVKKCKNSNDSNPFSNVFKTLAAILTYQLNS
jgi:hypothetical protein